MSPAAVGRGRLPDLALKDAGRLLPLPPRSREPLGVDQISGGNEVLGKITKIVVQLIHLHK